MIKPFKIHSWLEMFSVGHVFTGVQDGPMAEKIIKNFKHPKVPVIFVLGKLEIELKYSEYLILLFSICHVLYCQEDQDQEK